MTNSPTITYTLEEFLMRFETKIDRQFSELKQDIVELRTELKQDIAELKTELKQEIAEVKNELKDVKQKVANLSGDVKALDERTKGIDKRLENLEFIVRGGLVAFLTAFIGLILKVAGIIPNIKAI
jgi:predicted nuclease with TOPRIM domain